MSKNKKIILAALVMAIIVMALAGLKFTRNNNRRQLMEEATASYEKGAFNDAWAKVEARASELLTEKNGCELLISSAIKTQRFKEAEQLSRECLQLNKGIEISGEALAMILSQSSQQQEAINLLLKTEESGESWRLSSSMARLYLDLGKTEEARQKMLRALTLANPWDQAFQRAAASKLMDDQKFLEDSVAIILTKTEKFPELERKLLVKLWTFKLSDLANKLLERLGPDAVPPVDESQKSPISEEVKKALSEEKN